MKKPLAKKDIPLSDPLLSFDAKMLKADIDFSVKEGLSNAFIRRRIVFFQDGYRYAHEAAQKRWNLRFAFYETGHEPLKRVFQTNNLNPEAAKVWMEKMNNDPAFGPSLVKEMLEIIETEKRLFENAPSPKESITKEKADEALREHLAWWVDFFELAFIWFAIENIKEDTDKKVRSECKDRAKNDSVHDAYLSDPEYFLAHVYRPMRLPVSSVEQRDLLNLVELKGGDLETALQEHWQKYKHLSLHNIDDEYFDIDYYRSRVAALKDPKDLKQQKELLSNADKEIAQANDLLTAAPIPETLKQRIELVRWFMYLRTESIDHMMLVNSGYKPVFEYLADTFSLPIDAVLNMTYKEILDALEDSSTLHRDIIMDRTQNGYAYFIGPDHSALVAGADVDALEKACFPNKDSESIKEMKGQIAFPGKVTGIARVILDRRNASQLKSGEILVTAMTSPEFVPAMKLSAAVITNEGGVLCHAAIMSRELRKPCIIGTKLATDTIKTGDTVEVDAEKGIVKIIKG